MNLFQEVFASVNPRSRELLRGGENYEPVDVPAEKETTRARRSYPEPHNTSRVSGEATRPEPPQPRRSVVKRRTSPPKQRKSQERHRQTPDDEQPETASIRAKYESLQNQIDTMAEQIQIVEGSIRLAHSQNMDLYRRNAELQAHVGSLRMAAAESNQRMIAATAEMHEKAADREESWATQVNELLEELALLRGEVEQSQL
jgi:type IV secretory pathway VirB10-like protein